MATPAELRKLTGVSSRFAAFVLERHPLAVETALKAFERAGGARIPPDGAAAAAALDALRPAFRSELQRLLDQHRLPPDLPDPTPRVTADERLRRAHDDIVQDCDGFLRRAAIEASLTREERLEILRGMILTRAVDNRLKTFFSSGEIRYENTPFQGKGFRSLGQEAIFAAPLRLRRGPGFRRPDGTWGGDVVAPMIRDLGAAFAMRSDGDAIRMVLNAQMAKSGPPMEGRDLNIGDFSAGILPPSAPLGIATMTIAGLALAFWREGAGRVAVSFIGEGGASLGEWHEAINACAARRLPAVFCIENNQTALSTPVSHQSAARVFADKAAGYGVPGITIDGTDPDQIAAAFTWAAERAREGLGPTLIELIAMRMCGHAHHDDMLYLGRDPHPSWDYPTPTEQGYIDRDLYAYWAQHDPIACYVQRLGAAGVIAAGDVDALHAQADALVEREARAVCDAPWPTPESAGSGVLASEPPRQRVEVLDAALRVHDDTGSAGWLDVESPALDASGATFLEAIAAGVAHALRSDPRVFVYGQDVGGKYGNAFLLLKPLLKEFGARIINSPLAEGSIVGVCVGAALAGQRPIGEIQFNDFIATGFNQVVNNAAKLRYRWGADVPMVLRMPFGGLRHAGPFHSQNTEAWFYRTPGLKIVVPSTPHDALALLHAAVQDPDPVLFYEHIALYRDPRIKQRLSADRPPHIPLGRAALRRDGHDLAIVTYGAFVHVAMRVAERLASEGVEAAVLDLRTLAPLDKPALLACARRCHRVLIAHEDTRTGSVGESLAAILQEEAFEWLDAPVRVIGALDTPVPYSPALEAYFLPGEEHIASACRLLVAY